MNKWMGCGRLVRDVETRYSQGENSTAVTKFTLAVDRRIKKANEAEADFIGCVAFGKTAEFVERYFSKGMKMIVEGHIATGSYTNKENVKVYTTEIMVEQVEFAEAKRDDGGQGGSSKGQPSLSEVNDFMPVSGEIDETLPFN